MALFEGEDLVPVTTHDGRTLQLPRSLVPQSMMPQQFGTPVPVTDELAGAPPLEIPSVTGGQLPPLDEHGALAPQQDVIQTAPQPPPTDYNLGTVDTGAIEQQRAAQAKQQAQQRQQQAAYDASAPGQMAGMQRQQQAAYDAEDRAVKDAETVRAAGQQATAEAKEYWNGEIDRAMQNKYASLAEQAQLEQKKMVEVENLSKKIAGTKIDRSADHPILAAISIALAGLGSAMKGESTNPAIDAFFKAIDRKVAGQMADLDQMGKIYGMTKDELMTLKDSGRSKLEMHNIFVAGELDKSLRHLDALKDRTTSDTTKVNIPVLQAQIMQRRIEKAAAAVQWGLDYQQKEKQHAESQRTQRMQIGVTDRHNRETEKIQREGMTLDWDKSMLGASGAKGGAAAKLREEITTRGVKGVDNSYLMNPLGRAKQAQADKLEADARQIEASAAGGTDSFGRPTKADPMKASMVSEQVAMRRERAAQLRDEAAGEVVLALDTTTARELGKKAAAGQSTLDTIDEIKQAYDSEGLSYFTSSAGRQEIQTKINTLNLQIKEVTGSGAWDKGLAQLYKEITGGDPTDGWNTGVVGAIMNRQAIKDPEGFKKRLDSIAQMIDRGVTQEVAKTSTWDGKGAPLFTRKGPPDPNTPRAKSAAAASQERAPVEREVEIENRGAAARLFRGDGSDAGGLDEAAPAVTYSQKVRAQQAAAQPPALKKRAGLGDAQISDFDGALKARNEGDPAADERLVGKVVRNLESRPALALAYARNIRQYAPDLYPALRAAIPEDSAMSQHLDREDLGRTGAANVPTAELAHQVAGSIAPSGKVGNQEGLDELARRSAGNPDQGFPPDPEARKALADIIMRRNQYSGSFGGF